MLTCSACAGAEGAERAVHAGCQLFGNAQVWQCMHAAAVAACCRQPQGAGSAMPQLAHMAHVDNNNGIGCFDVTFIMLLLSPVQLPCFGGARLRECTRGCRSSQQRQRITASLGGWRW